MNRSLIKTCRIGGHEVGPGGEARPSTLLDYLQEAAGEDAAARHFGVPDLLPLGRTWVLSRYHLEFHRFPGYAEELRVETWPSGIGRTFATRDFTVDDGQGRPVVRATSSWAILDLATRRPIPLSGVMPEHWADERRAIVTDFPPLPAVQQVEREARLPVMLRDLDVNVHVNHVVYVQWALETVPVATFRSHRLAVLEVAYRAEARHGDIVLARRSAPAADDEGGLSFAHTIVNAETGAEVTRLRTTWVPRSGATVADSLT